MKLIPSLLVLSILAVTLIQCKKQDEWLDEKYNLSDVVPKTLEDFQGLLDNSDQVNNNLLVNGLISTDNFYVLPNDVPTLGTVDRNTYTWQKDIYQGVKGVSWTNIYTNVMVANVVMDGLEKIKDQQNDPLYGEVKARALFFRSLAFYSLAQTFAKPYTASATTDLGIPLRMTADVNVRSVRATLKQTYDKILEDLLAAAELLPNTGLKITRPSKGAAYALLAKTYLQMQDYVKAELYASKALAINSALVDFTKLAPGLFQFAPISRTNPEYYLYATSTLPSIFNPLSRSLVDTVIYNSYEAGDLRKTVFYQVIPAPVRKIYFKGSYTVAIYFGGLAVNEMLLIKAESLVRQNKLAEGMDALNTLRQKRWNPSLYTPKTVATVKEGVDLIIAEKRRELPFTGQVRWEDLRRLNQDPNYAITLTRKLATGDITLPPNDPRYVLPIPDEEIRLSGMEQNIR